MKTRQSKLLMLAIALVMSLALCVGFGLTRVSSAATRKTYTLCTDDKSSFSVYSPEWPNEIDRLGKANQLILHSTVNPDGNDWAVEGAANGGFAQNNDFGTAGWGLNGLTMKFYLGLSGPTDRNLRMYFVNNVGWYAGSNAGFALWLRNFDYTKGTAEVVIQTKMPDGEAITVAAVQNMPINLDYDYFTDTAADATDEAGQKAAPATGTLNTWRFYFDEESTLMLEFDAGNDRTKTIDLSHSDNETPSPQDRLYDFSKLQAGETTNMVAWFADGQKGAMRITEVSSDSEEPAQGVTPRGYANASQEPIYGGYSSLGFAKFGGVTANSFDFAATYDTELSLTGITTDFLVEGGALKAQDVYRMTYTTTTGEKVEFTFKKPADGDADTALLTGKAIKGSTVEPLCEDVSVPFVWTGIGGDGNLVHSYNQVQIQKVIDTYVLTVNGETPVIDAAKLISVIGSSDPECKLTFSIDGSAKNALVVKPVQEEAVAEIDTPAGYDFIKTDSKGIKNLKGNPMFYTTANESFDVGIEGTVAANSFRIGFSLDKLADNTKPFRIVLNNLVAGSGETADPVAGDKQIILEIAKTEANKADLKFILSDNGTETVLKTESGLSLLWSMSASNELAFLNMDNGTSRLFLNRGTAINFGTDTVLNAFLDSNFKLGGTFTVKSLGDVKSIFVARGVSDQVLMNEAAAGWKPGARNKNADFVYGTDGSIGILHTESTSQMYSSEIGIGNFTAKFKLTNWTAGGMTFGLQDKSSNADWFTIKDNYGLVFILAQNKVDNVPVPGKAVLKMVYNDASTTEIVLFDKAVIDFADDTYYTFTIRKDKDNNWVIKVNDTLITAKAVVKDFNQETFNTAMEEAVSHFTQASKTGNGYFVNYTDGTNKGFTSYFMTLTTGTVSIDNSGSDTIKIGGTTQLTATVSPSMAVQTGTWSTSNASVATVDQNGLVTAVAEGSVVITFTADDGSKTDYDLTVSETTTNPEPTDPGKEGCGGCGTIGFGGIAGLGGGLMILAGIGILMTRRRRA